MRAAIIEKINKQVKYKITEESQVVYIFVQCRKYLESISTSSKQKIEKYPTLCLFSDWVLHSKLNRVRAVQKLDEFSDFFLKQKDHEMFNFMVGGFKLFEDLKNDLMDFSVRNGIDITFIKNKKRWQNFVRILFEVLKDIPLQSNGNIKEFAFTDGIVKDSDGTFLISFTIRFQDKSSKHFSMDLKLASGVYRS